MKNQSEKLNMLTIITPTYNRKNEIQNLFASLQKQTDQNFQWLVMDDGSADGTSEWFAQLPDTQFSKEYHAQPNGGKHTALNASHPYIMGRYMTIVDSDDTLTENAVEIILREWTKYQNKHDIGMIVFKKGGKSKDNPEMDTNFPAPNVATTLVGATNQGMGGDHCETARTELFTAYQFPVYTGERFVGEALMWINIAKDKKVIFVDRVVYVCEYLDGGLTKSGRAMRIKNPRGGMAHAKIFMEPCFSKKIRMKNALLYVCYGLFSGLSAKEIATKSGHPSLAWACMAPGWALYRHWKRRYGT